MHLSLCACLSVWSPTGVSRVMSPEQVGADVLRHLLDVAAQYLGHSQVNCDVQICDLRDLCATNGGCFDYLVTKSQGSLLDLCINVCGCVCCLQVNKAVIAVPAKFDANQVPNGVCLTVYNLLCFCFVLCSLLISWMAPVFGSSIVSGVLLVCLNWHCNVFDSVV